jgi:hypothetical protein
MAGTDNQNRTGGLPLGRTGAANDLSRLPARTFAARWPERVRRLTELLGLRMRQLDLNAPSLAAQAKSHGLQFYPQLLYRYLNRTGVDDGIKVSKQMDFYTIWGMLTELGLSLSDAETYMLHGELPDATLRAQAEQVGRAYMALGPRNRDLVETLLAAMIQQEEREIAAADATHRRTTAELDAMRAEEHAEGEGDANKNKQAR